MATPSSVTLVSLFNLTEDNPASLEQAELGGPDEARAVKIELLAGIIAKEVSSIE